MAPEVAHGTDYDARVDIYSLGIVLYRLMNGNRLPFHDTTAQVLDPRERWNAVERRLRGDPLPPPCEASPEMAAVILRACAYAPEERFADASEMKAALAVSRKTARPRPGRRCGGKRRRRMKSGGKKRCGKIPTERSFCSGKKIRKKRP